MKRKNLWNVLQGAFQGLTRDKSSTLISKISRQLLGVMDKDDLHSTSGGDGMYPSQYITMQIYHVNAKKSVFDS